MRQRIFICICVISAFIFMGCGERQDDGKQTLTIGIIDSTTEFEDYIETFKENNPNCEVIIKDYRYYDGDNISVQDFVNDMLIDIVSGNGPDIISWGYTYTHEYAVGNAFMDLTPYVEEHLSKEEYFVNVLQSFSVKDELYIVAPNYSVNTMIVQSDMVDDKENWTVEQYIENYKNKGQGMLLCLNHDREQVANTLFRGTYGEYIDWGNRKCDFTNERFISILEFAKQFPESADYIQVKAFDEMWRMQKLFSEEKNAVDEFFISELNVRLGKENYALTGWPSDTGGQHLTQLQRYAFSISAACKNVDLAYEFLDGMFEKEFQEIITTDTMTYPILKEVLYERLDEASEIEYKENDAGELEPVSKYDIYLSYDAPLAYEIYQITEEERESLLCLIESIQESSLIDYEIHMIFLEEIESYFADDKTAEEVADIIEKRVQIYMNEQY